MSTERHSRRTSWDRGCSSRGSGAPIAALIPAKRDSYPKRYRHGPLVVRGGERGGPNEKELVEMTREGPRGRDRGFAPGTFRREASGGIAEPLVGEASGEAANRSEVATNSKYVAAMCALTKSRAKKWYNSGGPRGGGTGEIPPRGPLWAGRLRATPGSRNFTRAYRVLRIS